MRSALKLLSMALMRLFGADACGLRRRAVRYSKPNWPQSRFAGHPAIFVSANASLVGRRLEKRREAHSRRGAEDRGPRHRPSASALALHASQRRRAGGRIESAPAAADHPAERHRHAVHRKEGDVRRRPRAEQPHHAAALRSGRGEASDAIASFSTISIRPSAWSWSATISMSPTPTPSCAIPTTTATSRSPANGVTLTQLPGGPIDHHWTKSLTASRDGSLLYVGVGSNSNITENGIEAEKNRAAIWEVDRASGRWRIFASGLRNPNGLTFEPESGALWTVVNERDELGPNLVPDYLTSVKDGGVLWMALQLLRPAPRSARAAAAPGSGREGDRSRLRAKLARGPARPRLLHRRQPASEISRRRIRRRTRKLGPADLQRIQGRVRALQRRASQWQSRGCRHRFP